MKKIEKSRFSDPFPLDMERKGQEKAAFLLPFCVLTNYSHFVNMAL